MKQLNFAKRFILSITLFLTLCALSSCTTHFAHKDTKNFEDKRPTAVKVAERIER